MKIRNGYVSNSSSSSFVVALIDEDGYEVENDKVIVKTGCDDNGIEYGKTFVGKSISISDNDNCGMNDTIIDVDEIKNDPKEFENMFEGDEKKMKNHYSDNANMKILKSLPI